MKKLIKEALTNNPQKEVNIRLYKAMKASSEKMDAFIKDSYQLFDSLISDQEKVCDAINDLLDRQDVLETCFKIYVKMDATKKIKLSEKFKKTSKKK